MAFIITKHILVVCWGLIGETSPLCWDLGLHESIWGLGHCQVGNVHYGSNTWICLVNLFGSSHKAFCMHRNENWSYESLCHWMKEGLVILKVTKQSKSYLLRCEHFMRYENQQVFKCTMKGMNYFNRYCPSHSWYEHD